MIVPLIESKILPSTYCIYYKTAAHLLDYVVIGAIISAISACKRNIK